MESSQETRRGDHQEHAGKPPPGNLEVHFCVDRHLCRCVEETHEPWSKGRSENSEDDPEPESEPESVDSCRDCPRPVSSAQASCHYRRGGIGEENQEPNDRGQDGAGQSETCQSGGTKVTYHRCVRQQKEWFGNQCAE